MQVYATCPRGGQDREYRRLVAFAKTDHLQPGAAQRLELRIPLESLCAYDPDTGCWQWNAGTYYLWVGASLAQSCRLTGGHACWHTPRGAENHRRALLAGRPPQELLCTPGTPRPIWPGNAPLAGQRCSCRSGLPVRPVRPGLLPGAAGRLPPRTPTQPNVRRKKPWRIALAAGG